RADVDIRLHRIDQHSKGFISRLEADRAKFGVHGNLHLNDAVIRQIAEQFPVEGFLFVVRLAGGSQDEHERMKIDAAERHTDSLAFSDRDRGIEIPGLPPPDRLLLVDATPEPGPLQLEQVPEVRSCSLTPDGDDLPAATPEGEVVRRELQ